MRKRMRLWAGLILSLFISSYGATPLKWELRRFEDFLGGKLQALMLSAEGRLSLSVKPEIMASPAEDFYFSLVIAQDGTLYLGTGHSGKIYRLRGGQQELFFQTPEMDVTCLALDAKGILYAGTSPNGKIYRLTGKGQGDVFFNPEEKYIWDLLFTEKGTLLAAVGEKGGIYEISPLGEGKLLFQAQETHILCLHRTASGEVYAGSGGPGSIYLWKSGAKANILLETAYEEIKALTVDASGNIYAAAAGTPSRARKEEGGASLKESPKAEVTITVSAAGAFTTPAVSTAEEGREPGAVFLVRPDGLAKKIWSSTAEMAYSMVFSPEEKRIYFGTGVKGRIYALDQEDRVSLVHEGSFEQTYGLFEGDKKIFFLGNNPCTLGSLPREQSLEGEFLSPVLDARTIASWGRIEWLAGVPANCLLLFQSRSGNSAQPNETWSEWSPPYQKNNEPILSPKARYLQLKAIFRSQSSQASPSLQRVTLFYLPANLPPSIAKIDIFPPNEVLLKPPEQDEIIWGLDPLRRSDKASREEGRLSLVAARRVVRQGYQTFQWEASDENNDELVFTVYLRKEGERDWRLLVENWRENIYVLETSAFPDGIYELKVVASDAPSNPPSAEQKAEKISLPFIVDNTPPVIRNVSVKTKGNMLTISFEAEDSSSAMEKAEFMVRPESWRVVFPLDGICDSPKEVFEATFELKPGMEKMAVIRVKDRYGNVAVFWQNF